MVVNCNDVWKEISNYLENDVDAILRSAMEQHFIECKDCAAIRDGVRNVVLLYGDERMVEMPAGFSRRLQQRVEGGTSAGRRRFLGWVVAAAAAAVVATVSLEITRPQASDNPELRSAHSQMGKGVPPDMMVVVSVNGKIFHLPGCLYIHDKANTKLIVAKEAMREGYTPCVHCLKKYLG